jgi:outer membrane protein TolC
MLARLACLGLFFTFLFAPARAGAEALTIDSCVTRALHVHPALRAADHDIRAARLRLAQAGALEAPTLSVEAGKLGTRVSHEEHDASLRISQELGAPGARPRARAVAQAELAIAQAARASLALRLSGDVTRAYRRLQADVLSLERLQSLRRTAGDLEQMVNARLRTGGARYLDVLRARSERARIDNDVIESSRALAADRRLLNACMARSAEASVELADSLVYVPLADSLPVLLAAALAERPRLRAAQSEVERGESQWALARNGLWPAASVSAGVDRVPGVSRPGFGVGLSFTLPFVPWTGQRARIDEVRAESDAARSRRQLAQQEVEAAVRSAFADARAAQAQVQQFDRVLLADAADAIRTATQNYQAGQIDALELFESLRNLRTIELEYIRALLSYELALTDLRVAE